jgi:peptidyl-prolyl cis-trans isomerase C
MSLPSKTCRFILVLLVIALLHPTPSTGQPVQETLAMVNDVPITRRDVTQEEAILEADSRLRNLMWPQEQIAGLENQLVETLIDRELLYQRAKQRDIAIRSPWVDRALQELKTKTGSAAQFDAYLKSTSQTEEQIRQRIKKGLIVRRLLRREVIRQIKVSEAEMQAFYRKNPDFFIRKDRIRVRQIFIAADKNGDASQRAEALLRIQSIQARLREGANFTVLALEYSEDPSKASGGDLGFLERSQLIPTFADAAFTLQPGEISDIVDTPLGYHLIQMVDRTPSSPMAYRNARTKIERTLRRNKENAAAANYLAKLKSQAVIKRMK